MVLSYSDIQIPRVGSKKSIFWLSYLTGNEVTAEENEVYSFTWQISVYNKSYCITYIYRHPYA